VGLVPVYQSPCATDARNRMIPNARRNVRVMEVVYSE